MVVSFFEWFLASWVEISGALLGFIYIFLSIKQNVLTWPVGLLTSVFYIFVFFTSKFYADMALQFYYVWISVYGWVLWLKGSDGNKKTGGIKVHRLTKSLGKKLVVVTVLIYMFILFILIRFTDSPVPFGDSFTTALSIVATWMLARKILEHWLIWVVVDAVSVGLYIYKGLFATTGLFVVYTIAAILGFIEWRKQLAFQENG